jgi:AraC-like DNA-binding protein
MATGREIRSLQDFEQHIAARYLERILGLLRDESRDAARRAFANAGLDFDALRRHPETAPDYDLYNLLHELNRDDCCPGFSLRFGMTRDLLDLGVLGYTVLSAPDLGMALQLLVKYHRLTSHVSDVAISRTGERTVVRQRVKPDYTPLRLEIDEDHVTGILLVVRTLLGSHANADAIQVHFSHSRTGDMEDYVEYLGCKPEFGTAETRVSLPTAWLKRQLQTSDDTVEDVCRLQCDALVRQLGPANELVDSVRRLILAVPPSRSPKLQEVAASLMMSTRTLERRLQAAGTSYRRIDNDVRMQLAGECLGAGYLSIKEVAYLLGYSQPGTFYRAFKNWYGVTPGEFQRSLLLIGNAQDVESGSGLHD